MSEIAPDTLDIREQIVRIDRALNESAKFRSERAKSDAQAKKLGRDYDFHPWQIVITLMAAGGALVGAGAALMKVLGG